MEDKWENDWQFLPSPEDHAREVAEWLRDVTEALSDTESESVKTSTSK
jgi:hypothetical protein